MSAPSWEPWNLLVSLGDHLWQSTLVALLVFALAAVCRRNRAHVRYGLWLVASAKFFLPFSALVALGRQLEWPSASVAVPDFAWPAGVMAVPFSGPVTRLGTVAPISAEGLDLGGVVAAALLTIWVSGTCALILAWSARWRRVRAVVNGSTPVTRGRELDILRSLERRLGRRRALPIVASATPLEPGVFGFLRPVLLWPQGISERLDDAQIAAILAHELAHVRRRDNLASALHMAVQAVYWFHPLVWWLGHRLVDERERAADEDVLTLGGDPRAYAESILRTVEFHVESPLPCIAGVTGADLKRRIEQIMQNDGVRFLTARRKLLLASAAVAAFAAPVLAGALTSRAATLEASPAVVPQGPVVGARLTPSRVAATESERRAVEESLITLQREVEAAQGRDGEIRRALQELRAKTEALRAAAEASAAPAQGPDARPTSTPAAGQSSSAPEPITFEVASIKVNTSGQQGGLSRGLPSGGYSATNITLARLIRNAYRLQTSQLVGGPDWLDRTAFDIEAKAPDGATPMPAQFSERLKALLADRFKVKVHTESRELPVYALVLARSDKRLGPSLQLTPESECPAAPVAPTGPAGGPNAPPPCGALRFGPGNFVARGAILDQLARSLSDLPVLTNIDRIVLDRTGLTGRYTVDLTWTFIRPPGLPAGPNAPPPVPSGEEVTVFTALQEQLGLKLEPSRAPIDILVVDGAELPTEN